MSVSSLIAKLSKIALIIRDDAVHHEVCALLEKIGSTYIYTDELCSLGLIFFEKKISRWCLAHVH